MSTIPDTMRIIAKDVQGVFEELVKLLLRKSLRPTLNPLGQNTKIVYNSFKGRYERGLIGSSPDDNINKYTYTMTNESLGWSDEVLANFKVMAKFIKSNVTQRFPAGHAKTHNYLKSKARVAFSDKEAKQHALNGRTPILTQYKNFLSFLTSRNMQSVITNKNASFTYTSDIPYTHAFKQLESIGKDIADQTDPSICGEDSAKMSTAMLRVKLYNLEQNLANLSVEHPNIYDAYVEMLRIINSIPRAKIVWAINLIAALTYQRWEELPQNQQKSYLDVLGEDFILAFNSNELITILLQSNSSEVLLSSAYLYPLLKMLFIVFGYSKLVPVISDKFISIQNIQRERLKKHMERYRGATFRRGDPHRVEQPEPTIYDNYSDSESSTHSRAYIKSSDNSLCAENISDFCPPDAYKKDIPPVDPCVYEFIKLFGDLYPTIIGLMGGTEEFPPESIEISCNDIPSNYDCLTSVPEYLWRYNDFSYCRYLEYTASKQMSNAINAKINAKAKYLHSM
ncbi:hypothetical protein QJ857_gp0932 [Tupanvirus soda lake]|uniref:Uncharacterized protein n=2 Tax=Tupanvirus TaxID=2094720 RepID=A0A6N1P268_9VIRU|nr:hypothetical protein QJ857_gp0932 [Tupanvirus soda lake]QKU35121.1 hypothetical protein [Tupanvirus soda lake]